MANMPSVDKVQRNLRVLRDIDAKVMKKFKTREDMSAVDAYMRIIIPAVEDVQLDESECARIAQARKTALDKRNKRSYYGKEMRFK